MTRFDPQEPAGGICNEVTHDADCRCGARPDGAYERRVEQQWSDRR